jgi:hypothetical protein
METNAGFYWVHKSYWNNYTYTQHTDRHGNDNSYYTQWENNIGSGAGAFTDGSLNDAACNYLFIDSDDNVVINPDGLFHRKFVFTGLTNIKHVQHTYQH